MAITVGQPAPDFTLHETPERQLRFERTSRYAWFGWSWLCSFVSRSITSINLLPPPQ